MKLPHYEVLEKLGEGGMGVVYKARDTHLDRYVALKVLPPSKIADADRKLRFIHEAKAASALNHPNIITIHDIVQQDGTDFIVMEYVSGKTLDRLISPGGLPPKQVLSYATQIAAALAAAHDARIVHRDVKPSNIMVEAHGLVKVLDFGLAKLTEKLPSPEDDTTRMLSTPKTAEGTVVGTVAYMSPEQAEGKLLDYRSDIFSFGAVLYEMVTGSRAFQRQSSASTLAALLSEEPKPVRQLARDVPPEIERIIGRCLRKDREARYPSISAVMTDLENCSASLAASSTDVLNLKSLARAVKRPKVAVPVLVILLALTAGAAWLLQRNAHIRWATTQALPKISRLTDEEKYTAAYSLAETVEKYLPGDPALSKLWPVISRSINLETTPAGADVYRESYASTSDSWRLVGRTPLKNVRVPRDFFRWKIEKNGFQTFEGSLFPTPFERNAVASLDEQDKAPVGMVRVTTGNQPISLDIPGYEDLPPVGLQDYWIDKYEVTNAEFKKFVDQGGYQKKDYWKQEFRKEGRVISWPKAMALFVDATGRSGPAGWVQGDYPTGQGDFPASGISWYEAAAYAEFAGKSLPTIWHWAKAAGTYTSNWIVPASNFGGQGPARVGAHRGLGPWGTYDMAGNVKEWCWNEAAAGQRYILGGGWDEPAYMFTDGDARSPFDRSPNFGFRCAKYSSRNLAKATSPVPFPGRDYSREKPVSDELFRAYKSLYSYDKTPLNAAIESVDEGNEYWKREKITFAAAYGKERVIAYLYLPRKFTPPLQTVVAFPGSNAILTRSIANLFLPIDFLMKSGRAFLLPVYKGTLERGDELSSDNPNTSAFYRDHVIAWSKDLGRSVDYLETRPEIDRTKLAYFGVSWGAGMGAIMAAVETRFKVCVFYVGGLYLQKTLPEVDQFNFASRVKAPVLMLNGRWDFFYPTETSQVPLYRLLGAAKDQKRYLVYDGGHNIPRVELIRETLDWLDRYLGPVK